MGVPGGSKHLEQCFRKHSRGPVRCEQRGHLFPRRTQQRGSLANPFRLLLEHIDGLPNSHLCGSLCLKRGKSSSRITTIQDDETPQVSCLVCEGRGKRFHPYAGNVWPVTRGAAHSEVVFGVPPPKSTMADEVEEQVPWRLSSLLQC